MAKDLNPDFDSRTAYIVNIGKFREGLKGECEKCGCIFETEGNEKVLMSCDRVIDSAGRALRQGWLISCPRCGADCWALCPVQQCLHHPEDGESYIGPVGEGCFVATSCFNDSSAPEVYALRIWRDTILKNSKIGQCVVRIYYGGVGQVGARILNTFPFLKPKVRQLLRILIGHIQ